MNRHRRFLIIATAAQLAIPNQLFAQHPRKIWRIAYLAGAARPPVWEAATYIGFTKGMKELGYAEGRDYAMEWRFAAGKYERIPEIIAELLQANVDVILLGTPAAVDPLMKATSTIPTVVAYWSDPLGSGHIASLARPGGNITGLSGMSLDMAVKHLDLLRSVVPGLTRVAVLMNPGRRDHAAITNSLQSVAKPLGVSLVLARAGVLEEIERAFSQMSQQGAQAVIVHADAFFLTHRNRIADLAVDKRLASVFAMQDYAAAGGLMSYGQSGHEFNRRAAGYVDKIIKGAKVGDLPVEQPTLFELSINRKTAGRLGLTIPPELLISAAKIYE